MGAFSDASGNFKLISEIVKGKLRDRNQSTWTLIAAGGVMVKDMSSPGLLHSWSSSGVLDEVSPFLHQVSTDVFGYLNVPSTICGSNLSKWLNNLSNSNKLVHSSPKLGSNSVKGGVVEQKLNANTSNCSYLLKRKKGNEESNNVSKHQKSAIFSLSDNVNSDEAEKRTTRLIGNKESAHLSRKRKKALS
ncbi:hypothetical protein KY290_021650 [Solanum tuberosum]|uniref:Uncharacterized protein n=1 Tax=Solanum tuberosum TaxID=4113 RepID=A0ABQ7V259_SOLTU|nr:hypothetical protein KY290_021650 [Solanum tuberosum]